MSRTGTSAAGWWSAATGATVGDQYWYRVGRGVPLLDPGALDVELTPHGPVSVVSDHWPSGCPGGAAVASLTTSPVIYEAHVRGFARTFEGMIERLDHLVDLGVDVIELMPVHPFDTKGNYWGYMPLVWGAVQREFGKQVPAAGSLAALTAAAHERGLAIWLDVVFNHTGEGSEHLRTLSLRGSHPGAYLRRDDGRYNDDTGCGNTVDVRDPEVCRLILESLDRYASLGVDGFRFDLATILTRDGGAFAHRIGDWAEQRGVALVAEPWDLAAYSVGPSFADRRWGQWNDRFREDVRGFLRSEAGRVPAMMQRIAGSPDLFPGESWRSVNFITAHDGLTLFDLTSVTSERHRSWDCGEALRPQQLRNAFCFLLLSAGSPMFVMGDESARTQGGHDNPYDVDGPISWLDWSRLDEWRDLYEFVRALIRIRKRHAVTSHWGGGGPAVLHFHGPFGDPHHESRAIAWQSGDVQVFANMGWETTVFPVVDAGRWRLALATAPGVEHHDADGGDRITVPPRCVAVLDR